MEPRGLATRWRNRLWRAALIWRECEGYRTSATYFVSQGSKVPEDKNNSFQHAKHSREWPRVFHLQIGSWNQISQMSTKNLGRIMLIPKATPSHFPLKGRPTPWTKHLKARSSPSRESPPQLGVKGWPNLGGPPTEVLWLAANEGNAWFLAIARN